MKFTPAKLNLFLLLNLPSAWITGVLVKEVTEEHCVTLVRYRWINQNPFNSMYFAVQAMAAELSTGVLVMKEVKATGRDFSMLVAQNRSRFSRKARGRIIFICDDVEGIRQNVKKSSENGLGCTFWVRSVGYNEQQEEVSTFEFEWTLRPR